MMALAENDDAWPMQDVAFEIKAALNAIARRSGYEFSKPSESIQ
jgi:hypothetical protein